MRSKKFIASLLIIAIMISLVPIKIFATNTLNLTVTPSVTEAHPGDEITYTVKMSSVQSLAGMKFKLVIPEGLTFVEGKEVDGLKDTLNAAKAEFTAKTKVFVVGSSDYTSNSDTTLMTFKCSVDSGATGNKEITFVIDEDDIFDTSYDNIETNFSNTGSSVKITPKPVPATGVVLNKTTLTLEEGEKQKLVATISPDNSTDTLTWDSSKKANATVDTEGNVTAIAEGSSVITVTTTSGKSATCTVTVIKPVCKHLNKSTVVAKEPTCTTTGNKEYKVCDDCGKLFKTDGITETTIEAETIPALGHDFSVPKHDENQHWNECSRCHVADTKINHVGEGEYLKDENNHWKVCGCGVKVEEEAHTGNTPVKENRHAATCTENGSYDEVVYCSVCNYEMSRTQKIEQATGHTGGTPVKENVIDPTCTTKGSYDEVVYCTVCGTEISRTHKETDMIPHDVSGVEWSKNETSHWKVCGCGTKVDLEEHTAGTPVKENIHAATCTEEGSYDEVVYCSVCNYEMSRTQKTEPVAEHTEGTPVRENVIEATCTKDGSYDEVVYCQKCNTKLSTTHKTIPAKGHTEGETVIENEVEATVEKEGSYEEVVYCSECKEELSRTKKTTPKFVYTILEGAESSHEEATEGTITIKANGKFEKFEGIKVDDKTVDKKYYTAKSGSTIVTLNADYLNTLSVGEHKIAFVYDDGEVETTFKVNEKNDTNTSNNTEDNNTNSSSNTEDNNTKNSTTPNTGDLSNMNLWVVGLAISGILFVIIIGYKVICTRKKGRH